ncbi:non-specific lipid transfer protein GPI-anchored 10 [Mercurialis annua]|uniref:non-specific lipid transfer protein GPI-anchored 10 n=1 Tax=Mercurialis annua TaxID=3986 RepID=UPI00215F8607|nr:non-specific lipid transfer protein GPI-anchored 10 [Mercurialis annua]
MASVYPNFAIASIAALLLFISLPPKILTQVTPPTPTIADCTPRLLPLTTCAPFVQGFAPSPPSMCCDNLRQLHQQQPACVCLLLNGTTLSSFPINTTLALQLPALCRLQLDRSCSGVPEQTQPQVPTTSPASRVPPVPRGASNHSSNATHTNSTFVAASPMIQVSPRPIVMGIGLGRSAAIKLKTEDLLAMTLLAILLTKAIH